MTERIALLTYSTKPRGGVVHTLAPRPRRCTAAGVDVHRSSRSATRPSASSGRSPCRTRCSSRRRRSWHTLEERVFAAIDALEAGLR